MKIPVTVLALLLSAATCWAGHPVNINSASAEDISEALDGVGLSKAQAIVRYRDANGAFAHPDELVNVKGIGISTVEKNRDNILVNGSKKVAAKNG